MENISSSPLLHFEFHGRALEYFRIWIVNICLNLLTLGLYSPWAKVRQKRYFYGSTRLAGTSFDYLADPLAILKGRLIAVGVLLAFGVIIHFLPLMEALFWLAFIIALPWLVIRTHRFNAVNTVYRNIRFGFDGLYGEAFLNFVLGPFILLPMSVGFAYPWLIRRQKKFLIDHASYGNCSFGMEAATGKFWSVYFKLAMWSILAMFILGVCAAVIFHAMPTMTDDPSPEQVSAILFFFLMSIPLFLALTVYKDVEINNLVWNHAYLGGFRLQSSLRFDRLFILYVTNIIGIAFSLGLLIPWAKIRTARYRLECLGLCCQTADLQGFAAVHAQTAGALGEELSDFMDVDIGL